ncbi:MAG TPA: FAD-dependent oxidoreductase [Desulfosporosinus sp.]|nr:FAD-dependent oxidoreductase [Desulfosporosinus sp.]
MADVAIIGCGIVGAAAAYELSKYRLTTLVLEQKMIWTWERRKQTVLSFMLASIPNREH